VTNRGSATKEIARRLKIAEGTVDKHLVLGICALAGAFFGRSSFPGESAKQDSSDASEPHGE
jgi:hypothetical protein